MKRVQMIAIVTACGLAAGVASAQSLVQAKAQNGLSQNKPSLPKAAQPFRAARATNILTGETVTPGGFGTRANVAVYDSFTPKTVTIAGTTFTNSAGDPNVSWVDRADYVNGTGSGSAYLEGMWDANNAATVAAPPATNGLEASYDGEFRTDILFDGWDAVESLWPGGDVLVAKNLGVIDFTVAFRNTKTGAQEEPRILNILFFNLDPNDPSVGIVEGGVNLTYTIPAGDSGWSDDSFDFASFSTPTPIQGIDGDMMFDFVNTITVGASCPADFNGDTFVDDTDFVIFATNYDLFSVPPADPATDLNNDGFVDDTDFVIFAGAYDQFTCPSGGGTVVADGVGVTTGGGRQIINNSFTVLGRQGSTASNAFPLPEELLNVGVNTGNFPVRNWGWTNSVGTDADPTFDGEAGVSYTDIYNTATNYWNWWGNLGTTTQYGGTNFITTANETPRRITVAQ